MKKSKTVIAAIAALTLAAAFTLGACGFGNTDPGRLTDGEKESEFSSTDMLSLSALDDCEILSLDALGVAVTKKDGNYSLYDLIENESMLPAFQSSFPQKVSDGLYCLESAEGYTLCYKGGSATYADGVIANDCFTLSDGTRIYVNAGGEVTTEKDPLVPILSYENVSDALPLENYHLALTGVYAFNVFDETGKFRNAFDLYDAFRIGAEEEIQAIWFVKDTLFLQTARKLPSENKSYDLFYRGEKLDLRTYAYDVEDGRSKELIAFDFLAVGYEGTYDDYAVLRGYTIDDRQCGQEILQTFDEGGNVHVNLQKLLPNANGFATEGGYAYLSNNAETAAFYDGRKKYEGAIYSLMDGYIKGQGYYTDGNNLYIYDRNGELALTVENYYEFGATKDGRIYYVQRETEGEETFYSTYIYNGEPEKGKKDDRDDNYAAPTVQIGAKTSSPGVVSDGFYFDQSGNTAEVYALFGASPRTTILSADKNSIGVQTITLGETDYLLFSYTLSGANRHSLLTVTGAYKG